MARKRLEVEIAGDAASAEAALGGLGASLDALSDKRIEIKADDTELRRKIVEDRELIAELGTAEGRARLGLDDAEAKAKIAELKADIDSIGLKRARLSVENAEALGKIAETKAAMDTLHDKTVDIKVDKDGSARNALTGLGSKFDETAGKIPAMAAAAGLIGPAIVPAAAVATAGVGALLVPLAAATVGFGALGVLALPILSDVKTGVQGVTTAQDALTKVQANHASTTAQLTTAQNNLNAAWAKMTPIEADVVRGILDLKKETQFLSASIQPQLLGAFNTWLGDAHKLLPQLVAPAKEAALALNDLGTSVSKGLDSPAWHHFMDVITPQIRPAIDSIGRSFGNLVKGLGGVIEAFAPFAGAVESGMERVTRAFANWGQNLGASQGFQKFMDYVRQNGPQLKTTLEDLGRAGESLIKAFGAFGGVNLKILDDLAKAITAIASAPGGAVALEITALALAAGKLAGVLKLGTIITDLFRLRGAIAAFAGAEGAMASIKAFMEYLSTGKAGVPSTLPGNLQKSADSTKNFGNAAAGASPAIAGAGTAASRLSAAAGPIGLALAVAIPSGIEFGHVMDGMGKNTSNAGRAVDALKLAGLTFLSPAGAMVNIGAKLADVFDNVGLKGQAGADNAAKINNQIMAGVPAFNAGAQAGTNYANKIGEGMTGAQQKVAEAIPLISNAVEALVPVMGSDGGKAGTQYATGLGSAIPFVSQEAAGLGNAARAGASGVDLSGAGANAGQSFARGVASAVGAAAAAGAAVANAAAAAAAAHQQSPDKRTMEIGANAGLGYALGLEQQLPRVLASVSKLMSGAYGGLGPVAGPSSYGGLTGRQVTIHSGAIQVNLNGDVGSNPSATGSAIGKEVMRSLARELRTTG